MEIESLKTEKYLSISRTLSAYKNENKFNDISAK